MGGKGELHQIKVSQIKLRQVNVSRISSGQVSSGIIVAFFCVEEEEEEEDYVRQRRIVEVQIYYPSTSPLPHLAAPHILQFKGGGAHTLLFDILGFEASGGTSVCGYIMRCFDPHGSVNQLGGGGRREGKRRRRRRRRRVCVVE